MEKQRKQTPKSRLRTFFESRPGHAMLGVAALAMAVLFVFLAIDSGSLLDYAIVILLLVITARELTSFFKKESR